MPAKSTFKIIVAGDGGVGKTTLLHRYIENRFKFDTKMTIGVEIFNKIVNFGTGSYCSLQIWDFSGQERFKFLLDSFVMGTRGALVLFDLTRSPRFLERIDGWVNLIERQNKKIPMVLIGTKADLEEKILVNEDAISNLMTKHNFLKYYTTSSKTGLNVNEAFYFLTLELNKQIELAYNGFFSNQKMV
ncbi:MAG: Rab family GTPase [Promethearchaeota archaeon]|jgi:small GTP-binding protein